MLTIIIPSAGSPHLLSVCLQGLVKNSSYARSNRIIVLYSDPPNPRLKARDFAIAPDSLEPYRKYENIHEFVEEKHQWARDWNIAFHDVSCLIAPLRLDAPDPPHRDGVDIAFRNNLGLWVDRVLHARREWTGSDWIIPNWDDDFYPARGWDQELLWGAQKARATYGNQFVAIPMHIEATQLNPARIVTEAEWATYCARIACDGHVHEPCGLRKSLHYLPLLFWRCPVLEEGYSYMGTGYDVEMDNRLGYNGYTKVGVCTSFVLHKARMPWPQELM